ncbi:MAG: Gfo/Idh/MocA family oxidoreductase, partial [bacterium]|nr:Gfo/Idh/MocA family oxidoreductase [bacterium]
AYAHNSVKQFDGDLMSYVSYPTPIRQNGGGELMNLGSHAVDYLYWLFGMPRAVLCRMHNVYFPEYGPFGSEDIATLWCEYEGMVATLTLGRSRSRGKSAEADAITLTGNGVSVSATRNAIVVNGEPIPIAEPAKTMVAPCVQHLIDAIEQDLDPLTGIHNGLAVIQIKTAAYQSAQSGQMVTLPLTNPEHPLISPDEQTLDSLLD